MAESETERPFDVVSIDHVVLRTHRPDQVLAFYRDTLGLPVERVIAEFGLHQLRAGFAIVDILDLTVGSAGGKEPPAAGQPDSLYDHFCLSLSDADEEEFRDWLAAEGVAIVEEGRRYGAAGHSYSFYVHDPDGRVVELKLVDDDLDDE